MKDLINKYIGGIQRFQLLLETLTPVAIRSGEVLSPLTDYHIEGNKLYLLDTEKIMNDIAEKGWLDDFEARVMQYSGNHSGGTETNAIRKNRFIADFLKENNSSIKDYLIEENVRMSHIKDNQEWVQLHSTIKTNDQAYIPGSSIKGAIRTAVMYHWLTETDEGKGLINQFVDRNKNKISRWVKNIDDKKHARAKVKDNQKEKNDATEDLRKVEQNAKSELLGVLLGVEEQVIHSVFGKADEGKYNAATFFNISDTTEFKNSHLITASLEKKYREDDELKKKRNKEFTPSFQEFIDKDNGVLIEISTSNFKLDWKEGREIAYFASFIKDSKNVSSVFKAINKLSSDFLQFETGRLNGFKNGEKSSLFYSGEKLESLHNSLEALLKQIADNKNNTAIMCVGFGKSIFLNTVLLAIRKSNSEMFTNIVKVLHSNHPKAKYFPISYYTANIKGKDYPLGWLKITDTNEDAYKEDYDLPSFNSTELRKDDIIKGVLIERGSISKVEVSIDGTKQVVNANGLPKFEKMNNTTIPVGKICDLQIVAIKDNLIKDLKIVK
jgi:CRISPR/Cas system CSM-associated protein Csm5 (group 7 of RAMP superfamily)